MKVPLATLAALPGLFLPIAAQAQPQAAFCAAIDGLRAEAARTGRVQRVAVHKLEPMEFACSRRTDSAVGERFCSAALDAVGLEFTHAFPWEVYDCLVQAGVSPTLRTSQRYTGLTGRTGIERLSASWPDAVTIEIRYRAEPDDDGEGLDPRMQRYWGRYDLVARRARR